LIILGGQAVPDHDAVVLRVRHEQHAVLNPDALRRAQAGLADHHRLHRHEIRLPEHKIGRLPRLGGNLIPEQNAIVRRIGHSQVSPIGGDRGGEPHPASRSLVIHAGKIRLAQNHRRALDAQRAASGVGANFRLHAWKQAGDVIEHHHPVVDRDVTDPVGIGHEEGVVAICQPPYPAEQQVGGA